MNDNDEVLPTPPDHSDLTEILNQSNKNNDPMIGSGFDPSKADPVSEFEMRQSDELIDSFKDILDTKAKSLAENLTNQLIHRSQPSTPPPQAQTTFAPLNYNNTMLGSYAAAAFMKGFPEPPAPRTEIKPETPRRLGEVLENLTAQNKGFCSSCRVKTKQLFPMTIYDAAEGGTFMACIACKARFIAILEGFLMGGVFLRPNCHYCKQPILSAIESYESTPEGVAVCGDCQDVLNGRYTDITEGDENETI